MSNDKDKLWYRAARAISKASQMPVNITDTVLDLLKLLLTEEQAKFLLIFKKPTLNIDEIKEATDLDEKALNEMLDGLMKGGIIVGAASKRTGIMVYRLMPFWPGIFEYQFLRGTYGEKDKQKAELFEKLFEETQQAIQKNYDSMMKQFEHFPAIDRTIPVEKHIDPGSEGVMPYEELKKYIENYDDIAVANCYCRHEKELLNDPCKLNAPKDNCFFFDKSAKFVIEHEFGKPISKEDALEVFRKAEDHGLVHKVFHVHLDTNRGIEAICNCCKCCCGPLQMYYRGAAPFHTVTSYLAKLDEEKCIGCGTCVKMCPMETIELNDAIAQINEEKCIGCGVCAHHCTEEAIYLERTGPRDVFILPPRIESTD